MPYRKSVDFSGNPSEAINVARTVLLGQGFSVTHATADRLEAKSPWMMSSGEAPLRGLSTIQIEIRGSTLNLTAGLRNVVMLILFLLLFPPALALILAVTHAKGEFLPMGAVWFVFGPLVSAWLWFRTRSAVNSLLRNMANAASPRGGSERALDG